MEQYQEFIAASRYARWLPERGRRETWDETVNRYMDFWSDRDLTEKEAASLRDAITDLEVMPSMRCMMTAGAALDRDNVGGFNCAYMAIDHPRAFDEMVYILMCGTGVGFGVEKKDVKKLPEIAEEFHPSDTTIVVADSKIGWAKAFRQLVSLLYAGEVPKWDTSRVREAGAPLKTFGGRASGPAPLIDLFNFTVEMFTKAAGRQLNTLECSDLCNKIAQIVVVGGVRRSAEIGLSDPSDDRLRHAKTGAFPAYRYLSNNSAVYTSKPDMAFFLKEMVALHESKSGERGIFSRVAAQKVAARNGRRESDWDFGTNPCSEIILRPNQFCNLTEVVIRPEDTFETLKEKVRKAAILGTLQATLTDFRYLRKVWKTNTEEEALLGLSLTGIMDHPFLGGELIDDEAPEWFGDPWSLAETLEALKEVAVATNKEWAKKLGINQAAAITCVKPSGTVSQLVDSASGIHPRFSEYYIRTVRCDTKDPMAQYMQEAGFPCEPDFTSPSNLVFSFPVQSPKDVPYASSYGAMQQLKIWKTYQDHWCEHKPSVTVYYRDDEFPEIIDWMWTNFDILSGISLLPYDDHVYPQAPYQPCTKEEYEKLKSEMPDFDWVAMSLFEGDSDSTLGAQELACTGGSCEL